MSMDLRLSQRVALQQHMTPQLAFLMHLLARPWQELRQELVAAVIDNPALEEVLEVEDALAGPDEDVAAPELEAAESPHSRSDEARLLEHLAGGAGADLVRVGVEPEADDDEVLFIERAPVTPIRLAEHLGSQLHEEFDDDTSRSVGEWIIGNLDPGGYFGEDVGAIGARFGLEPDRVEALLRRIQRLDPLGVATRDARECLLIQAQVRFPDRPHLASLIAHHLPALKERRYPAIARVLGISVEQVIDEEERLVLLNPWPARGFGDEATTYIAPDVYIFKVAQDLVVRVNEDGLPKLRVSQYYRQLLNARAAGAEELAYVRAKISAAKWWIKSIYDRQQTIQKVTEAIVQRQRDFLDHGRAHLRPMTLRDIADDVGMSESTVSRVTSRKYAETPQGLLGLRSFFGAGVPTTNGAEIPAALAKDMIQRMITAEDPRRPLTDQDIVSRLLVANGVKLARRTVAKYREVLGIAPSCQRRGGLRCRSGDQLPRSPAAIR
jgi:RNA polymerase sigma-54 factor